MKLSICTDSSRSRAIETTIGSKCANTSISVSGSGFCKITLTANSDRLAYIDPVAVGILEHKSAQTVVLVLNALDDAQSLLPANRVQRIDVVHHHMRDIE